MFTALTCLAALCFSIGGYFMKQSAGLTQLRPTLLVFALFVLGAGLQTMAMRGQQMAVTYIVVLGLETVTAFFLGVLFLNEGSSLLKLTGVGLVLAGIVTLRVGQ